VAQSHVTHRVSHYTAILALYTSHPCISPSSQARADGDKHQALQRLRDELEEEFKVDKRRLQEQLEQM
jgi:hypothetical protein